MAWLMTNRNGGKWRNGNGEMAWRNGVMKINIISIENGGNNGYESNEMRNGVINNRRENGVMAK